MGETTDTPAAPTPSGADTHEHSWTLGGLRYTLADYPNPGGSAYAVTYYDWFFCSVCLAQQHLNPRTIGNSFHAVIAGATPR